MLQNDFPRDKCAFSYYSYDYNEYTNGTIITEVNGTIITEVNGTMKLIR